jgi:hypothetical protein
MFDLLGAYMLAWIIWQVARINTALELNKVTVLRRPLRRPAKSIFSIRWRAATCACVCDLQIVDGRMFVAASDNVLRIYTLRGLRPSKQSLRPLATAVAVAGAMSKQSPQQESSDSGMSTAPPSRYSTASSRDSQGTRRLPMTTSR